MTPLTRTGAALTAAVLLAAPVAAVTGGTASAAPAVQRAGWNGWRHVAFDTTITAAHRQLGGRVYRTNPGGGCGDVLDTRGGSLNGNTYRHPHQVGTIILDHGVAYPLGVDAGMRASRIERVVRHSDYVLHTDKVDETGHGDYSYLDTVVGPGGHTLWFAYDKSGHRPYRMGLSVNRNVAEQQLTINGC